MGAILRTYEGILGRLPRYATPGIPQHVVQRGNNRTVVFAVDADYRFFHACLCAACEEHGCRVHAYAFMTNHVHLLMTPTTAEGIGKVMHLVARRYVERFNTSYRRIGHMWGGRYKATIVDTEQYLFACHRYIELNPVRAGLVEGPGDYPWSSYRANALGTTDALVTRHERYETLGPTPRNRRAAYRAMFDAELSDSTIAEIRNATNRGWALGNQRFRDEVAALLGRRTQPAPRGRPALWK